MTAQHALAATGPTPIVGVRSGRYVDVTGATTTNGTPVQLWDCNGRTNQSRTYTDSRQLMVYGSKCLDASGQGTSPGTQVIAWDCNGQNNQQWRLPAGSPSRSPTPSQSPGSRTGPCDIYAAGGTPYVAAHSTVRALYGSYTGDLYQVWRLSDSATRNIPGRARPVGARQRHVGTRGRAWCRVRARAGRPARPPSRSWQGAPRRTRCTSIRGNSYRRAGHLTGVPTGSAPEGVYMVTSGIRVNSGCCFDYGNSETTRSADAAGAMDAINYGTECRFGGCAASGPWVQADLERGLHSGGSQSWNPNQRSFPNKFVTAMLKNNGATRFALKGSDAQSANLTRLWDGPLPNGYSPMRKQGAIVLASVDSTGKRVVAIIGDSNGFTGGIYVNFGGLSSQSWLYADGSVNVVVKRIPDQAPLASPQVVLNQNMSASSGSISVPVNFQATHDAFAVYLTPGDRPGSPPPVRQSVEVVGTGSGRCVDVPNASTSIGTQVQLYDCWGGSNQRWTYTSSKQLTVYGNKCLDVNGQGTADGTAVIIWDCNGQANQQWNVNAIGTITGVQSGKCLDAYGAGTANGTRTSSGACAADRCRCSGRVCRRRPRPCGASWPAIPDDRKERCNAG